MEQKARASAEAAGTAYEPVTNRGGWLAEVPGLSDPLAAYEAGRAPRRIGYIFDKQGSPVSDAGVFLPQVADAVLYFALRGERQPFGAADMAFVFLETYPRG